MRIIRNMLTADLCGYLYAAVSALDSGTLPDGVRRSAVCPECELTIDPDSDDDSHVYWVGQWPHVLADSACVVLVGCEGYYTIDPNALGLSAPSWQPVG